MSDMISQAEIDALLGNANIDGAADPKDEGGQADDLLTSEQKDILGEIGNISMGTAATTLSTLLNQKVWITTPKVSTVTWEDLATSYSRPCVGVRVGYTEGLVGTNVLVLNQRDVKIIVDLMMGGSGEIGDDENISEIDLSAISEAMNQMVGSSSTSISSLINKKIDISTPQAFILNFGEDDFFENIGFGNNENVVVTKFRMEIGTLVDSEIVQIFQKEFAGELAEMMKISMMGGDPSAAEPPPTPAAAQPQPMPQMQSQSMQGAAPMPQMSMPQPQFGGMPPDQAAYMNMNQQPMPMQPQAPYDMGMMGYNNYNQAPQAQYQQPMQPQGNVNVQPVQFQNFDAESVIQQKENIGIIMDVPLDVTVELGRTNKKIKEILEFAPGSIIELDKLAGEPIDILVNGKFVARGEVVVIDENFGVRITDIISVENRI